MLNETFSVIFKHCVMDLFILQLLLPQLRHPKRRRTASKEAWRRMESHSAVLSFLHFVILQLRRARKKWGLTLSKKAYVCPWFMFHSTQSQPNLSILVKSDLLQQKTNIAWSTKKCHDSSWKKEYQEAQFSSSFWSCQNKRKEILHLVLSTRVRRPPTTKEFTRQRCAKNGAWNNYRWKLHISCRKMIR